MQRVVTHVTFDPQVRTIPRLKMPMPNIKILDQTLYIRPEARLSFHPPNNTHSEHRADTLKRPRVRVGSLCVAACLEAPWTPVTDD